VSWSQGAPAGVVAPGALLVYGGLFAAAGASCLLASGIWEIARTILMIAGVAFLIGLGFAFLLVPEATNLCRSHGGGICPKCRRAHLVKWWSV